MENDRHIAPAARAPSSRVSSRAPPAVLSSTPGPPRGGTERAERREGSYAGTGHRYGTERTCGQPSFKKLVYENCKELAGSILLTDHEKARVVASKRLVLERKLMAAEVLALPNVPHVAPSAS